MKKLFIIGSVVGLLISPKSMSQGVDEAYLFAKEQSFGTARSVAMGGAFGALGGDLSAINVNPAGVAVYRSSEFTFTPSFQWDNTSSNYYNSGADANKFRFTVNQVGAVGVDRPMRESETGLQNISYSFNYQRVCDFNTTTQFIGKNVNSSLLDQFRYEADGVPVSELNMYRSGLAYDTYLLDTLPGLPYGNPMYYNALENFDPMTGEIYREAPNGVNQWNLIEKRGNISEFGGSAGVNLSNTLFLGGSFNMSFLKYRVNNYYSEFDGNNTIPYLDSYNYNSYLETDGFGLNLKFGLIYRPVDFLRVGFAVQTPTWYSMNDYYEYAISSYVDGGGYFTGGDKLVNGSYDYDYTSPYKLTTSIGLVFGQKLALDIDYRFIDYGSARYKASPYNYNEAMYMTSLNNDISRIYKATNNVNVGLEFKPLQTISLRGGFIYNQSGIVDGGSDVLTYSCGVGFRERNYFVDVAYRYQHQDYNYYPYQLDNSLVQDGYSNEPASVNNNVHFALFTVGVKF